MDQNLVVKGFGIPVGYLKKNSPKNGRISFLSLEALPICDADCLYCSSWHDLGKVYKNSLKLGEYKSLINQAIGLGAKTFVFTGIGEPTLDSNTLNLVDFIHNKKRDLTPVVYTYGVLDQKKINFLNSRNATLLLKLDTLDKDHYEELIGLPYERFKNSLNRIIKTYAPQDSKDNLTRLGACTLVTNINKKDIQEVFDFCKEYKIKNFIEKVSKVQRAADNWEKLVGSNGEELNNIISEYSTGWSSQSIDNRCGLFAYGVTIDVGGDLVGCPTTRWIKIGNIREKSLEELIKIYRENILKKGCNDCLARRLSLKEH